MEAAALAARIDHTVLGPETTPQDVDHVLDEAATHGMTPCIPPCYLDRADPPVVTVVGFPHGQHTPAVKVREAELAAASGATGVDVVISVGRLLAGEDEAVTSELATVVDAVPIPVKAILETPLLDEVQMRRACEAAVAADVAMLKTATGFAGGGATVETVEILAEYAPVKASGGIRTYDDAVAMLEAGAERIGTSSGPALLAGAPR